MKNILQGGEPFLFPGGKTGCLLVHGFTGTPKEMFWLGEHLAVEGHTILGVRLFGHATRPPDMFRARWRDWLASVEDGYCMLRQACDRVIIMGLSMGGILSLLFGAHFPVSGIVAMSTPYSLPSDPRLKFAKPLSLLVRFIGKGPSDWRDPGMEKDHLDYPAYPVRAIAELRDMVTEMQASLPRITAPALIIHCRADQSVPPENAEHIFQALGSKDKQLEWVENSGHVITRDSERMRVLAYTVAFVRRVIKGSA